MQSIANLYVSCVDMFFTVFSMPAIFLPTLSCLLFSFIFSLFYAFVTK